jgi:LPS sulfotransferase NodH
LAKIQEEHSAKLRKAFQTIDRLAWIEVSYPDLVTDPAATIAKVADFLGYRFHNTSRVTAVVRPKLHRQR